jgi:CheY-like chemotaxis protein
METTERTVMLVDDCTIDNYVNKKMILYYKFATTVHEFMNPMKAIDHLRDLDQQRLDTSKIPDFLFLDLHMPVMDGNEFLQHYESLSDRIKGKTKIIVLSGALDISAHSLSRNNPNVVAFISKPLIKVNLDSIESMLKAASEKRFHLFRRA